MDQDLLRFNQFVLNLAQHNKTGLVPIFSTQALYHKSAWDSLTKFLVENYSGFVISKDNKYPDDNLKELDSFLKPDSIIFVNSISNSYHYSDILELSKSCLIVAGFECFCSTSNSYHDFISRFQRISHLELHEIEPFIPGALFCNKAEDNLKYQYQFFNLE